MFQKRAGAIKEKTISVFEPGKADVPELSDAFEWELGYFYTEKEFQRCGIASKLNEILISDFGQGNLMATTEISENPAVTKILDKNGFKQVGNTWKSIMHDNKLGLFLKFFNN